MANRQSVVVQGVGCEASSGGVEPFPVILSRYGLELVRGDTCTLQINTGLLCNQACRHCHLSAGPDRRELMGQKTVNEVVAYAQRASFPVIDITGGAPELNPHLVQLIERLTPLTQKLMLRSNLTTLVDRKLDHLIDVCKANRVVIISSLPSLHASQTDAQRGKGVLDRCIVALRKLNGAGYGRDDMGLELDLVSNPTGAFLPPSQEGAERKFRHDLERKWGVVFNQLFTFANVPLGRFRDWLVASGNYESYMKRLTSNFNPSTVHALMCRTLISVSWDGYLFDCDFNLAKGLFFAGRKTHVSKMDAPSEGIPIVVSDHCYACTAGSGFT
jgi:radical SAM/Cys-rich protein